MARPCVCRILWDYDTASFESAGMPTGLGMPSLFVAQLERWVTDRVSQRGRRVELQKHVFSNEMPDPVARAFRARGWTTRTREDGELSEAVSEALFEWTFQRAAEAFDVVRHERVLVLVTSDRAQALSVRSAQRHLVGAGEGDEGRPLLVHGPRAPVDLVALVPAKDRAALSDAASQSDAAAGPSVAKERPSLPHAVAGPHRKPERPSLPCAGEMYVGRVEETRPPKPGAHSGMLRVLLQGTTRVGLVMGRPNGGGFPPEETSEFFEEGDSIAVFVKSFKRKGRAELYALRVLREPAPGDTYPATVTAVLRDRIELQVLDLPGWSGWAQADSLRSEGDAVFAVVEALDDEGFLCSLVEGPAKVN